MSHPSRLALDRLALGAGDEETKAHAAGCAECQAHLQKVQVELPVPRWLNGHRAWRSRLRWLFAIPVMIPLAVATLAVFVFADEVAEFFIHPITPKAAHAEAVVWLKHDGNVSPWSGQPVHPNDSVELELAPGAFTQLTIAELTEAGPRVVLRQAISGHGMSPAFSFDEAPGPERMAALLSNAPLTDDEVRAALDGKSTAWTKTWTFPKETK